MTDIVERLRISEHEWDHNPHLYVEAADEIERLRAHIERLDGHIYASNRPSLEDFERLHNTIKNCPPVSESEYVRRLEDEVKQLKADNSRLCVDLFELSKTKGIEETARLRALIASTRLPDCGCGRSETTKQLLKGSS